MSDEMHALAELIGQGSSAPKPTIAQLEAFEVLLSQQPPVETSLTHYFSHGVYARELAMPAGAIITGKIHKLTNLNILLSGEVSVSGEDGIRRVRAPFVVVSPPGTKRVAYVHEDARWLTVHGTHETDLGVIEREFTAESERDYLEFAQRQQALPKE